MNRITVNKIWFDRRAGKPRWLCNIKGGAGPNATTIVVKADGCCRAVAYLRARRAFRKAKRNERGTK